MAGHPQLEKILAALSHLNLEGDITDKQENPIRFGGMCDVFTARSIKQNKKVAVKRIRAHLAGNEAFAKQFAKEIRVWVGLQHENVLPLLGFILGGPSLIPSLISEWMEQGILPDYTKKFPRASVHTCRMLLGIASGLSYLHAKGVIHADLKGQNILVSPKHSPLLVDFGLSRMLIQSQVTAGTTLGTAGTVRWMARELFMPSASGGVSKCNEMTDIWAFGMIAYELLSWGVPYSDKHGDFTVMRAITDGKLPVKPGLDEIGDPRIFEGLWRLCNTCWSESSLRPSATTILSSLNSVTHALMKNLESPLGSVGSSNLFRDLDRFWAPVGGTEENNLVLVSSEPEGGLNPTIKMDLEASVSAVLPKVVAAKKSFETVRGIVERFSADTRDLQLLHDWRLIEKEYATFLHKSTDLALHGAEIIHDFLKCVLPYLSSSHSLEEKRFELQAYCETRTLEEGQMQARKPSKPLESVATRVMDFSDKWQQRIDEAIEEQKESIRRLEIQICDLERSIRDPKGKVSELKAAKLDKAEKEKMKHQQEAQQRSKADRLVAMHIDSINSNTYGLRVLWDLIYDDLYLIETHLRVTASVKDQAVFQQRLEELPKQYKELKDTLLKYNSALPNGTSLTTTNHPGLSFPWL